MFNSLKTFYIFIFALHLMHANDVDINTEFQDTQNLDRYNSRKSHVKFYVSYFEKDF